METLTTLKSLERETVESLNKAIEEILEKEKFVKKYNLIKLNELKCRRKVLEKARKTVLKIDEDQNPVEY